MASLKNVKTVEDLEKILRGAFLLLPKTTNPWTYFAVQTNQILHRKAPSSLPPLLITASILIGLASLLYFIGLVVRWRKGTLWVFRVVRVDDERFILPSYISSYALFAGLFDLCLQSFLWILYVRTEQDVNPKSYFLSTSLPWLPGIFSVCLVFWSLTVTWILHLRAYANTARRPFYASAVFVNTVGISLPVIALASLLPFGILASRYIDDAMETSAQVEVVLSNGAAAWETNPTPDNAQIHLAATLLFEFAEHLAAFQHKFKVFFAVLAAWCGFLGFAFVAVAIRYLHDLNTCISEMRGRTKTGVETFSRTWKWLVLITAALGVTMVGLAVNVGWIAATLDKILGDAVISALSAIIPLYSAAVLGIVVSSIILHNAITSPSAKSLPSTSRLPQTHSATTSSKGESANLAERYTTQFHLAAALPLNRFAFLTRPSSSHKNNGELERDIPFDSLELQPAPVYSKGGNSMGGIIVERMEETVTVVALPKEGGEVEDEMGSWREDGSDDKKW